VSVVGGRDAARKEKVSALPSSGGHSGPDK